MCIRDSPTTMSRARSGSAAPPRAFQLNNPTDNPRPLVQVRHVQSGAVLLGLFDPPTMTDGSMPGYGRWTLDGKQNEWVRLADNVARNFAKNYLYRPRPDGKTLQSLFQLRSNGFSHHLLPGEFVVSSWSWEHVPWAGGHSFSHPERTYRMEFRGSSGGIDCVRSVEFRVTDCRPGSGSVLVDFDPCNWTQSLS
eukprot:TRINITY_DN30948_c0_g1_i1.p1 TRINITY_DN30948_c0_g1~~TRINITY_DN30948_c0_g1_i1.p1  ORF type:complete len:194 (+),score=24.69 TRINITY_DN30948_c0_g1_i1:109-690(+)